ncbi:MAG: AMP-binding protein, partial [bacterium]|nr:AMP-binding protein [bacterium]
MKKEDKKNIANIMALTPVQQGMLFHYLKEPAGELYFEQLTLELSGKVEKKLFEKAWNTVIQTNEMLRTVFRWEKIKNPLGVVLKQHTIKPRYYDSQDGNSKVCPTPLEEIKTKDRKEGFDLREVPFRITLYKHETNRHTLIISNHHILYDGWSNGILLNEFFSAYDMMSKGDVPQPITKTPFKDFIKWHRDRDQNKNKEFWKNYLSGIDAQSELSIKRKTNKEGITVTGTYNTGIEDALTTKTHGLAEKYKLTPAAILYTTWGLLVQRYNNNEDAIFGTTVSGRNAGVKGIEDMVGLFINTIPLRVKTESPSGVTGSNHKNHKKIELLQQVDEALRQRQEYDGTSLVKIKEYSDLNSSEELFDIIVVIDNYPLDKQLAQKESALAVTSYSMTEMTHYDLTVGITLFEGMELSISYDKKRFEKERIARLTRHFKNILQDVVTHPLQPLSTVKMMSAQELKQLIYDFNNTNADYPRDKTIHELFEEQVEKTPDSISTVGNEKIKAKSKKEIKDNKKIKEDKELTTREKTSSIQHPVSSIPSFPSTPSTLSTQLTYRELNKKANHLANQLHDKGFTPGAIAGMAKSSSVETIIAILAIWKAGGSYLPIDLTLPVERVKYMLADANAKILLCEPHDAYSPGIEVLSPGRMPTAAPALRALPPGSSLNAYIIYTSGTTGKPKGVMVPHSAFVNRLYWLQSRYAFGSSDVIIQKTPITFDVSLCELLRWIPGGGRLVIMEQGGEKEPAAMVEAIVKNRATTIDFIPSMLSHFLDYVENNNHQPGLSGLRWVFTGVEPISQELLRRFNRLLNKPFGTRLINAYGPTEATVDITYFDCSDDISGEMVPIGRPIQNTQIYILDKQGRTQPLAVPGELCIA